MSLQQHSPLPSPLDIDRRGHFCACRFPCHLLYGLQPSCWTSSICICLTCCQPCYAYCYISAFTAFCYCHAHAPAWIIVPYWFFVRRPRCCAMPYIPCRAISTGSAYYTRTPPPPPCLHCIYHYTALSPLPVPAYTCVYYTFTRLLISLSSMLLFCCLYMLYSSSLIFMPSPFCYLYLLIITIGLPFLHT